jgi:hypothetical protein
MCVFKYHAFIFSIRPPRWQSETVNTKKKYHVWWTIYQRRIYQPSQVNKNTKSAAKPTLFKVKLTCLESLKVNNRLTFNHKLQTMTICVINQASCMMKTIFRQIVLQGTIMGGGVEYPWTCCAWWYALALFRPDISCGILQLIILCTPPYSLQSW